MIPSHEPISAKLAMSALEEQCVQVNQARSFLTEKLEQRDDLIRSMLDIRVSYPRLTRATGLTRQQLRRIGESGPRDV